HDEPRIASILSLPEQRAAALLILSLPGMRFLHDGQLSGARLKLPVQLGRRSAEPPRPEIAQMYAQLLHTLKGSAVGRGTAALLRPRPAWPGNPTAQNFVIVQWLNEPNQLDLAVVNLAPHRSQCLVSLQIGPGEWEMKDLLGSESYRRS